MENNQEVKQGMNKKRLAVLLGSLGVVVIFVLLFIFVFRTPKLVEFTNLKTAKPIDAAEIVDGKIKAPKDPSVLGWDFVGWCTDTSHEVVIDLETYEFKDSTTLYAKWELHRYKIHYNLDGGKIQDDANKQSPYEMYCSNCNSRSEDNKKCQVCEAQMAEAKENGEELTINYTLKKVYEYVIKHEDKDDHTWKFDFPTVSGNVPQFSLDNALLGGKLATPIKEGYTFEGWFTSPTFEAATRFTDNELQNYITKQQNPVDITLYAMWAEE